MRIAIVDDEQAQRDTLRTYLERFSAESGSRFDVKEFPSGDTLLENYHLVYDIILFDVDMPGTNGINTARQVREMDESVTILFITNMAQYAINAFEVEAADYIIKPIEYYDFAMKFRRAVKRAVRRSNRELTLDTVDGVRRLKIPEIVYVEALDHYLTYHMYHKNTGAAKLEVRSGIGEHEALLKPYHFCRVHKSFLINLAHIDVIRTSEVVLNGVALPIGRRYKKNLMENYMQFMR